MGPIKSRAKAKAAEYLFYPLRHPIGSGLTVLGCRASRAMY
jgi:hypothetical protein